MTTAYHGQPVPITTTGTSSQAGLATFRGGVYSAGPGTTPVPRRTFAVPCPFCDDGHLIMTRVRSSIDGDPTWQESCDTCPYELEL